MTPAEKAATEAVIRRWRERFPNNMYAWPAAVEDFALEAVRAVQDRAHQQQGKER